MSDRNVHASSPEGELVRYEREGRWYFESPSAKRKRLRTVHEAVAKALEIEGSGGVIRLNQPGGGRFDSMVKAAHEKKGRDA